MKSWQSLEARKRRRFLRVVLAIMIVVSLLFLESVLITRILQKVDIDLVSSCC